MPYATAGGQELYYDEAGPADAPAVLLSHGLLMDRRMFAPQLAALAPSHRCIAWDQRGHGLTGAARGPFDLWESAADALGLLAALGLERAVHVGMSLGGFVALRAALRAPETVRGLVLIATQAGPPRAEEAAGYELVMKVWRRHGMLPELADGLAAQLLGPGHDPAGEWQAAWAAMRPESFSHCVDAVLARDDLSARLAEIDVPAIVIHGEADAGLPSEHGAALADALGAELVLVPGAGHACNLTHPEPVNAAIERFLRSLEPAPAGA